MLLQTILNYAILCAETATAHEKEKTMIDKIKLDKAIDIRNKYMKDMKENGVDLGDSNSEMIFCTLTSDELYKTAEYLGVALISTEYYDPDYEYEYREFFIYRGVEFFHLKKRGVR